MPNTRDWASLFSLCGVNIRGPWRDGTAEREGGIPSSIGSLPTSGSCHYPQAITLHSSSSLVSSFAKNCRPSLATHTSETPVSASQRLPLRGPLPTGSSSELGETSTSWAAPSWKPRPLPKLLDSIIPSFSLFTQPQAAACNFFLCDALVFSFHLFSYTHNTFIQLNNYSY